MFLLALRGERACQATESSCFLELVMVSQPFLRQFGNKLKTSNAIFRNNARLRFKNGSDRDTLRSERQGSEQEVQPSSSVQEGSG